MKNMLAIQLAFKTSSGAGFRTILNIAVLSFAFVVIIFYNGVLEGWNQQARRDTMEWEIGQGQLWVPGYDPLDFSYQDAHGPYTGNAETPDSGLPADPYPGTMAPLSHRGDAGRGTERH